MFVSKDLYNENEKIEKAEIPARIVNSILDYNDEQDREKEHFIVFGLNIRYKIKFIDGDNK
jgi:hypothetical protein